MPSERGRGSQEGERHGERPRQGGENLAESGTPLRPESQEAPPPPPPEEPQESSVEPGDTGEE